MTLAQHIYTPKQYLALERKAAYKSEYINGQIYAMAGASIEHITIVTNLVRVIGNAFVGKPCRVFSTDLRVRVEAAGLYTYPDVVALCGELQYDDLRRDTITNPTVIVEVLSPSTASYDRVAKFNYYRRLSSLREYVMVSQDKVSIEQYVRQDNKWVLTDIMDMEDTLQFVSIGCEITLRDIYDKVDFPQDQPKGNPEAGIYKD